MNICTIVYVDDCEKVLIYKFCDGSSWTLENILFFVVNHEEKILKILFQ